jgi:3-deoxy-7-phosphoheptulonate synthase
MRQTSNLHVVTSTPLPSPAVIKAATPISERQADAVAACREAIKSLFFSDTRRLLVVVGPCSIHDTEAARAYAELLLTERQRHADELEIVMRVYFEKPRTTTGWKGLINDPHLDGSHDMDTGLRTARCLLSDIVAMGLPTAGEMLDPITPHYLADLIAWGAIGARTTESQTHRMLASGVSMPIGFKNGTDGSLQVAVDAITAAAHSHHFLGIGDDGLVSVIRTTGNGHCHVVLRGGASGPNHGSEAVAAAAAACRKAGVCDRLMVDCSHGNSLKDHNRQSLVAADLAEQIAAGNSPVRGVMIESFLMAGKQPFPRPRSELVPGQSITDACIDFPATRAILDGLADAVRRWRSA